jgi:plastocyanin
MSAMGFPTKVQLISRKASEQYYVNVPSAVAQAMQLAKGETVEWIIADKSHLILARKDVPPHPVDVPKKTGRTRSASNSTTS